MNTLLKQTLSAGVLSAMLATSAFAAPSEAPPDFVKRVADGLVNRLKAEQGKLQNNPTLVNSIIRQNLDPYIDSQAFTRIVLGTYANNQYTNAAQRAQFEKNFRAVIIENYGGAFAKYTNESYTMRPYKATASKFPVVTLDFLHNGEKIPVSFQLNENNDQWKIRNVNVSGIDLGLQFRNQFAATVQRSGGDINKAIATFKPDGDAAMNKK